MCQKQSFSFEQSHRKILRRLDCLGYESYFGGKSVFKTEASIEGIDMEWMQLILEAKELGLDQEEIRKFLQSNVVKEQIQNR